MKKTAIIILNYNNPSDTINCIRSVEKYNSAPVKYVIVDNGSTKDDSVPSIHNYLSDEFPSDYLRLNEVDRIPDSLPYVTLLISKTNDGYARGNNKGLNLVKHDHEVDRIMILNNDILFVEDIIPKLCDIQSSLPDCGIVSPLLLTKNGVDIDWNCARLDTPVSMWIKNNFLFPLHWLLKKSVYDTYKSRLILTVIEKPYPPQLSIELPSGSCMLIDKELFFKIGCFDPATFLYYEENILYRKLSALNLKNYIVTGCKCIHLGAATMSKSPSEKIRRAAHESRNYYVKNYLHPSPFIRLALKTSDLWVESLYRLKNILKP